jgi:small subunit ribosomal protein S1
MKENSTDNREENFAELLEKSAMGQNFMEPGQALETEIVAISGDTIFLQLNGKSEGILDAGELTDRDGNLTVQEGETIKVFFLKADNGEMRFTTRISSNEAGLAVLENAYKQGIPVEGAVEKETKGGFEVKIGESRAFCPFSQMGEKRVEDPAEWIGKHLTFKIIEHGEKGRNIIVSNRALIEAEKDKQRDILKETLKEGMAVKGKVVSLQPFGAFVDIDGFQALLPISEISRERVEDISEVFSVGQEVEGKILSIDWAKDRISVSRKAMLGDPWDDASVKYREGSRHKGKVVRLTEFGAFVTLEPGLDGLIHKSAMAADSRDANPRDILKKGQEISVQINSIDIEKKRISLKLSSLAQEEESIQKYMEDKKDSSGETYNPFAALLKDRMKK